MVWAAVSVCQQGNGRPTPRLVEHDGRYALVVDGKPFLMLGLQVNNSSAWPSMLPKVWPAAEALHVNTIEMPIYWEQFEPRPGVFDDSSLQALLAGARAHHLRLVLLWFGTWKNGSGHYTPEWMKRDEARFPHVQGRDGRKVDSLSPFAPATLEEDKRAFATLMRRLRTADPQRTVIMVQVENESGTWGSVRDFGPEAQRMFSGPVPSKLLEALQKQPGTWSEVFGNNADEFFHAWSVAHYIGEVAAAGKAEYDLPMYVNTALRDPLHPGAASTYESGGPTDNVIPIWKAAAPAIDLLAPDIYYPDYKRFERVLELYSRPGNALFVPELGKQPEYARYIFAALGKQALGFSPFGLDYTSEHVSEKTLEPFAREYAALAPIQRQLAQWNFEGKLQGVSEDPDVHDRTLQFPGWETMVSFGRPDFGFGEKSLGNPKPVGGALIVQLEANVFLVTGLDCRVDFRPRDPAGAPQRQFLRVEEGAFVEGRWKAGRILNGDQTDYGLNLGETPRLLRVELGVF